MFYFLSLVILFLVFLAFIYKRCWHLVNSKQGFANYLFQQLIKLFQSIFELSVITTNVDIIEMTKSRISSMLTVCFIVTLYIIIGLSIVYCVLGLFFAIYTYQYAWIVAVSFRFGSVSFGVEIVSLFALLWVLLYFIISRMMMHF